MNKTAILPIVVIVCGAITLITKKPIGADAQDMIATIAATAIGSAISIWGVIKNHQKDASK